MSDVSALLDELYGPVPEPVIPPGAQPGMTPLAAAAADRRRLVALGRITVHDRADGRADVYVQPEQGEPFSVLAETSTGKDVADATIRALLRRRESDRVDVERLRDQARRLEDEVDWRRARDRVLAEQFGRHDPSLPRAERRLSQRDGELFEATRPTS